MALAVKDRVQESTSTTGTGSLTLGGAVAGYQSFASIGNGNTTFYCIVNQSAWEVGVGTYSTSGPTLARTTVLSNSLGTTSPITLVGDSTVFCTYPAEQSVNLDASGNVTALGTITSGVWNGSTLPVAYGGTGVTSSSGVNSVVLRDASANIIFNNFIASAIAVTASAGITILTVASARTQLLVGSTTEIFQLPNATTLTLGHSFVFVNNSSGVLTVTNNGGIPLDIIPSGGVAQIGVVNITTPNGSWGVYSFLPGAYNFNNITADFGGANIINAVWHGTTIEPGYGGTGLTTFIGANNALYSTSSSALTAGTLPVPAGGTGATSATAAMANLMGFTSTVTSATPVVLTNTSSYYQVFTGSTAQTITLPVTSTLQQGWTFHICNNNTSNSLTINTSGGNALITVLTGTTAMVTCIATGGTGIADWEAGLTDFSTSTGGGSVVLNTSPTIGGTLAITGAINASTNTATILLGSAQTTGILTAGGTTQTGTLTVGQSTVSQTTNIQAGATASGSTKTMNVGTGGLSGSTTTINIGSTFGTNITANGTWTYSTPLAATNMVQATTSTSGYLTSTDWNTFNNKQPAGSYLTSAVTSATAGTGVFVSASTGAVSFSIGQSVGTADNTQFNSLGIGTAASSTAGEIRATNNITAYFSDDRMKTNLGNIPDALAKLKTLNGFYYEANDVAQAMGYEVKKEVGVSAQQVQAVMPEVVAPAPIDENYLTVRYERLVPLLIEAIKELEAQVAELKAR